MDIGSILELIVFPYLHRWISTPYTDCFGIITCPLIHLFHSNVAFKSFINTEQLIRDKIVAKDVRT